jgi:hypothetical protein
MTSYIDGENGLTNFANIMGEDCFDNLEVNNLIVDGAISLPSTFTGINASYNNNTYSISNFELVNLNGSTSNLQNQINSTTVRITGINYVSGTDTTTLDNNCSVSGRLANINATLTPNTNAEYCTQYYTDQQVAIAYSRGTQGINDAASAHSRADDAYSLADSAKSTADTALGIASGAATVGTANTAAIATLGTSVATLQGEVSTIQGEITTIDEQITALEGKTQFMTANLGTTTTAFNSNLNVGSGTTLSSNGSLSIYDITTNAGGTQNINGGTINLRGSTVNIGASTGASVNVGTDGGVATSVSIGALSTPVYICGVPYLPFSPTAFGSQW